MNEANLGPAFALDAGEPTAAQLRRQRLVDVWLQVMIAVTSLAAIYLVGQTSPAQKWGYVIGLASQPLWLAATYRARQWGMFFLSGAYAGVWLVHIVNHFGPGR